MTKSLFDALIQKGAEIIDRMGAGSITPDEAYREWQYESGELRREWPRQIVERDPDPHGNWERT